MPLGWNSEMPVCISFIVGKSVRLISSHRPFTHPFIPDCGQEQEVPGHTDSQDHTQLDSEVCALSKVQCVPGICSNLRPTDPGILGAECGRAAYFPEGVWTRPGPQHPGWVGEPCRHSGG